MKILVGLSKNWHDGNSLYKMCIIDTDVTKESYSNRDNWKQVDINELSECVNVRVDADKFQTPIQNPSEYISADFDLKKIIESRLKQDDFQITNVYYDENGEPQLYRAVHSNGYIGMHDISELSYKKENSILGNTIEELPNFVKKEPLSSAYEWWKIKDEEGKKIESRFFSGQFETYGSMPVRLLYHYLTGVRGFKVGYHTQTEISDGYSPGIQHDYSLYKDTAIIKLRETIPLEKDILKFAPFYSEKTSYPDERKLSYCGVSISMICTKDNYPKFDIHSCPSSKMSYGKDEIAIHIDDINSLMHIYNKLEESGCISKEWKLNEYGNLFGLAVSDLLPEELALLSVRLQSEKEGTMYNHVMCATNGHWSTFNTDQWMRLPSLVLATQFYSPDFKEKLNPIFQDFHKLYEKRLQELIETMGPKDALETMKWTKEASKEVLKTISLVRTDGSLQKANINIVDELSSLYTFKRNNYSLPEWLQIYSPETIKALGGVELLQELIAKRGEQIAKESIPILAEGIEKEISDKLHNQRETSINKKGIIIEEMLEINAEEQIDNKSGIIK